MEKFLSEKKIVRKKLVGKTIFVRKNFVGKKFCWKNICQKKKKLVGKTIFVRKNLLEKFYWKTKLSEIFFDLICNFVYQMGGLCGGPQKYQTLRLHFFSMGGWWDGWCAGKEWGGWWWGGCGGDGGVCLKINFPVLKKIINLMKDLKYEHQSIKVGGWWGSWRVGGWRVHGVVGCVVVWAVVGCMVGWVVGELMGWVHILTHP